MHAELTFIALTLHPCPALQPDPHFDAVRALLSAAPPAGEPRHNFVCSLYVGIAAAVEQGDSSSVFGLAGQLLELALGMAEAPEPAPAGDRLEDLLRMLWTAAAAPDVQVGRGGVLLAVALRPALHAQ